MHRILFLLLLIPGIHAATGQNSWHKAGVTHSCPVCYGSGVTEKVFIPPPPELLDPLKSAEKKSNIIVDYSLFPPKAIAAFEHAKGIWEGLIDSPVPIHVEANWRPQGQNTLGSCKPADFKQNFNGAPQKNRYYPIALAEKLAGTEITGPDRPDIIATFNQDANWYFGTDGDTPGLLYDFVTVVLHELAHGLGFYGFFFVENNLGRYGAWSLGDATPYDQLVETATGSQLINPALFPNPSLSLKNALVSGSLYANSPAAYADGHFTKPRLFAPSPWDDGSSVYHLDDDTYPGRNINTLMTPFLGIAQAIHDPGPVTMGILADMGWKTMNIRFDPPKDREEATPVHFQVDITSDYPLDSTRLFVVLSTGPDFTKYDSLLLKSTTTARFEAVWQPGPETNQVQYYISASDIKNRVFRNPSNAPMEWHTLRFGPDTLKPVISHNPVPFFFENGEDLFLSARVEDNMIVDTVFIEYSVNSRMQQAFGLNPDSASVYSAAIPFDGRLLSDRDTIRYKIIARDASQAQNTTVLPESGYFLTWIEKMFEPVTRYSTQFDHPSPDFILFDFQIYTAAGFDNGALHSPHPYPSTEQNDEEFNFSTLLKYPVIVTEGATLSYDEIVLVEPGDSGTVFGDFEFWDYVIAEGSKDRGKTWIPLVDGYDSGENDSWEKAYNSRIEGNDSKFTGTPDLFVHRQVKIPENGNFAAGDTILIRFRLFSDPLANGWGWAIDNLHIQSPVSAGPPLLSPGNIRVYPNPFHDHFTVDVQPAHPVRELRFDLYNSYGQKLESIVQENITGALTVEVRPDKPVGGMYLLVISENGNPVSVRKLIHH